MGDSAEKDTLVAPRADGEGLCLVASVDGALETHGLPESGELTIGRAPDNGLQIDHPSVSRHHARIVVGERVTIEDLGSANGVRLREQPLAPNQPAPMAAGELVELGQVMLFLRRRSLSSRPRRVWPHGYFEARVEEECERASVEAARFAVARVDLEGAPPAGALEEALGALGPFDVVAQYAPGQLEVFLTFGETLALALRAAFECCGLGV